MSKNALIPGAAILGHGEQDLGAAGTLRLPP
jgi:hypothetical protein